MKEKLAMLVCVGALCSCGRVVDYPGANEIEHDGWSMQIPRTSDIEEIHDTNKYVMTVSNTEAQSIVVVAVSKLAWEGDSESFKKTIDFAKSKDTITSSTWRNGMLNVFLDQSSTFVQFSILHEKTGYVVTCAGDGEHVVLDCTILINGFSFKR